MDKVIPLMKKQLVHVATIGKPHGIHGLVRVHSYLENATDLEHYKELIDDRGERWTLSWKNEPIAVLYDGNKKPVDSRTNVEQLTNRKLYVTRDSFSDLEEEEFYLVDLIGLQARVEKTGQQKTAIGIIDQVHDYGAGTSLEIKLNSKEIILVPFTKQCVPEIDLEAGWVTICLPHFIEVSPNEGNKGNALAG